MRSYSPRHKKIERQLRERKAVAAQIEDKILQGIDVTPDVRALQRSVATDHRGEVSELECFRCGALIDEDSGDFGVVTVNAASTGPTTEPTRYKGEFMPVLPLCTPCTEYFYVFVAEQEV